MATGGMIGQRGFGETMRRDAWWTQPLVVFLGLSAFIIYTTWAAFQGKYYFYNGNGAEYLSPFYSPLFFGQAGEPRWFAATHPSWWPAALPFSAAFLILIGPAGVRFTCYYYRGAYYKAFWADPPACAVGEPRKVYRGEAKLPLIFQNIHRYFFYIAVIFVVILAYDAWRAMWFVNPDGSRHFGIGVGTLVLLTNVILLGGYTFGCHCARHVVGGYMDAISKSPARKCGYKCVSSLNRHHMLWAWVSLVGVLFSDIYVRLCSMGVWTDWRLF
jgi:hypothetical protein